MARSALLDNQNFRYLWAGDAIGQFGAQLAGFVIPVFAVQYLHASEMEMGVLNAAEQAAFLVIGLPVGAWVDRMRKRRVMIVTDVVRALVLSVLVALTFTGHASIPVLIAVALAISVCNTFFDVAYQSFVPAVTGKRHLLEGNSKLEATHSVMFIVGPALGGLLIRFVNPIAVLGGTVVTYLASAFTVQKISLKEELKPNEERRPLPQEIKEGLAWVLKHRVLRRIVMTTAASNLFNAMAHAVVLIFILRHIGISEAVYGVVVAIAASGGLFGAVIADKLSMRVGVMRILPLSAIVWGLAEFLVPVGGFLPPLAAAALIALSMFATNFCILVYNIAQVTYRQRVCPTELLGRMNASVRFIVWGVGPIGALLGGWIGSQINSWTTLWIAAVLGLLTCIPILPALWGGLDGQAEIEAEARRPHID